LIAVQICLGTTVSPCHITLHNMPLADYYSHIRSRARVICTMTWPTSTYTVNLFREHPFMLSIYATGKPSRVCRHSHVRSITSQHMSQPISRIMVTTDVSATAKTAAHLAIVIESRTPAKPPTCSASTPNHMCAVLQCVDVLKFIRGTVLVHAIRTQYCTVQLSIDQSSLNGYCSTDFCP